ncbi:MAG: thiamine diphosphokinase [Candidatus Cloacimonetes bacterium]|nr:thiamine diphosphokinase [Candidatus Cloacimonadota bacterium]
MKKAFIFCNNPINYQNNNFTLDIDLSGTIIAADGGANYLCKKGIIPDVLIGDFDSISPEYLNVLKKKSNIIKFPVDKDKSDTELAIEYCLKNGYNDITLINAVDGRLDHSLTNIFLIEKFIKQGLKLHFLNAKSEIYVVTNKANIPAKIGTNISLISLTDFTLVKETKALKFPLNNEKLYRSSSRGISNITTEKKFSIIVSSGILLVIIER